MLMRPGLAPTTSSSSARVRVLSCFGWVRGVVTTGFSASVLMASPSRRTKCARMTPVHVPCRPRRERRRALGAGRPRRSVRSRGDPSARPDTTRHERAGERHEGSNGASTTVLAWADRARTSPAVARAVSTTRLTSRQLTSPGRAHIAILAFARALAALRALLPRRRLVRNPRQHRVERAQRGRAR